jgi:hypothetical protein
MSERITFFAIYPQLRRVASMPAINPGPIIISFSARRSQNPGAFPLEFSKRLIKCICKSGNLGLFWHLVANRPLENRMGENVC